MAKVIIFLVLAMLMAVLGFVIGSAVSKKKKGLGVKIKKLFFRVGIVFLFMAFVAFLFRKAGVRTYDSFEEFQADTGVPWVYPESAMNTRMAVDNKLISITMLLSFSLDDAHLNDFICRMSAEYYTIEETYEENKYYNLSVSEIDDVNSGYTLDDFPYELSFDEVIDDSVDDYTVIYYSPVNFGTSGQAILYNKATNTVLEYYLANIR